MSTGSSLSYLSCCFTILCVLYLSKVNSSPTEAPCNPGCNSTSVCENGRCIIDCTMDCNADSGEVCGSDSITYTSQCELNRQNCLNGRNITISYDGICYNCSQQKEQFMKKNESMFHDIFQLFLSHFDIWRKCNPVPQFTRFDELSYPFNPKCNKTNPYNYALSQTADVVFAKAKYIWCSTYDGYFIKTSPNTKESDCNKYEDLSSLCEYESVYYLNEETISEHENGTCICEKGEIKCYRSYKLLTENEDWTEEIISQLKEDVIQSFYHQYDHADKLNTFDSTPVIIDDLAFIAKNPADITSEKLKKVLEWKFGHYNKNGNDVLEESEVAQLHEDVSKLTGTKAFKTKLTEAIYANKNDKKISLTEWNDFFVSQDSANAVSVISNPVRRSINKLLRTRKNLH